MLAGRDQPDFSQNTGQYFRFYCTGVLATGARRLPPTRWALDCRHVTIYEVQAQVDLMVNGGGLHLSYQTTTVHKK